jgi:hypothetical protein
MSLSASLAGLEPIVDASGVCAPLEAALPVGVRRRQLSIRTLLVGILLALADHRPAHLTRVHQALIALDVADQWRLGVIVDSKRGPHTLTYRQTERTFGLLVKLLGAHAVPGCPSDTLAAVVDQLMEASIPDRYKHASSALAIDWTDLESWALPPHSGHTGADPDASWGHRASHAIGVTDELFYGYYPQIATMVAEDHGPPVPELARRLLVTSCHIDPPRAFVAVLERMHHIGIILGDLLSDSGYAHRVATHWALPLRRLGARLITDLHPADRGPKGTHAGATMANGNLYCPCTPPALLHIAPLARNADPPTTAAHDTTTREAAHYKLGRQTTDDPDGYHRVACPAVAGKLRCPLHPESMRLSLDHPEILNPPQHPPPCCTQTTMTVPPEVNAKTAQKHHYPGTAWRNSYARRSAAERTNATIKDPATNNIRRGSCRLTGLTAITLFLTCTLIVRNRRIIDAFETRQTEDQRRAATGQPPRTRRRRRRCISELVDSA